MLVLLMTAVTGAWATEKSINDIAVDDIIKHGDVITNTDYIQISYDGHIIALGNWSDASGTVTVTRGSIVNDNCVENAAGEYFLFNDSQTGLQGWYSIGKTLYGIPYNESGLKVTGKTWDSEWEFYTLTVELAPASAEPAASATETTVTFTASDLADGNSITKDGVTLTAYGQYGINMNGVNGPGEFTNSLGGNFTKIVVTADNLPSGDGWSAGTWNGSASSVSFTGNIESWGSELSIVCTLETPAAEETVTLNHSANNTWAIAEMPGYDVELEVEYFDITVPTANTADIYAGSTTPLINAGSTTEEGATMKYLVTATNEQPTSTDGFSADVPTAEAITAQGTYYVWYYLDLESGDDSDISALAVEVTVSAPAFAVTIDDAGVDASNWQATPAEQKAGQTVTLSYSGKKKIRSITIEKAAAEPAAPALLQVTVHESDWSPGSGDHIIYYASGETWAEAIANHPTENAGWSVSNNFVYYNAYQVYDGSDAVMADNPIENGHYEF